MTINGDYYMWLIDSVDVLYGRHENYLLLMQHLFTTKYEYAFEMDRNRAMAGENLRVLFAQEAGLYLEDVNDGPCNVLEMLIALAKSIAFDTSTSVSRWFWEMIRNLGLMSQDDEHFDRTKVNDVLGAFMQRTYQPSGEGSLFPIRNFKGDMRKMELWDQKNVYLTTLYPVGNWLD